MYSPCFGFKIVKWLCLPYSSPVIPECYIKDCHYSFFFFLIIMHFIHHSHLLQKTGPQQKCIFAVFFPFFMDLPAVQRLYLEQKERSLEDNTQDLKDLVCLTHYPDRSLCVFYHTSLSEQSKTCLGHAQDMSSPREDLATFVEWVLVNNRSAFTIGPAEPTSLTPPDPEPSQS